MTNYSKEIIDKLNTIRSKRPRTVIQHILKHGYVTTEELERLYGYQHAPRAARDVRELGVPLLTFYVKNEEGRRIAAYKFGDLSKIGNYTNKVSGRTALSKTLKKALVEKYGSRCFVYMQPMDENLLQIDHRVPYEIGGNEDITEVENFMLLSPSANRAKSWTCEHCSDWVKKDKSFCLSCFWACPENYTHIADKKERIITITFTGNEIEDYNKLIALVGLDKAEETIKKVIKKYLL